MRAPNWGGFCILMISTTIVGVVAAERQHLHTGMHFRQHTNTTCPHSDTAKPSSAVGYLCSLVAVIFFGSNTENAIMDKRNNAIGIDIFKKAGINATTAQLTQMVDIRVFEQLNAILGRTPEEQGPPTSRPNWRKNFSSPKTGPDLYFPRKDSGKFIEDKNY